MLGTNPILQGDLFGGEAVAQAKTFDAAPNGQPVGNGHEKAGASSDSFKEKKAEPLSGMSAEEKRLLASPYGFAKYFLGLPIYDGKQEVQVPARACRGPNSLVHYEVQEDTDWQKRVLDALDQRGARVSLRTANGSGKTSTILVAAILWHMAVFPNSLVISTAGVDRQVRAQLWPNLRKQAGKLKGWVFHDGSLTIEAPNGARYMGFTTDKPERAEGWHGKDAEAIGKLAESLTGPLFIIVDEAKGIPVGIFEAFDRCTYQRLLYCSSPGVSDGEFYKSQTNANYPFTRFCIPARLCPHADHAKNAQTIAKRGIDHPLVRSAIFSEFAKNDQAFVLTEEDLNGLVNNPPRFKAGDRAAFCDFAAGGDENVFAVREGNRVKVARAWRDTNTMSACAEFVRLFRAHGFSPETAGEIMADADGLGTPMCDRLGEMGWEVTRCRNGERADNAEDYFNWGTETWLEGAQRIRKGEFILEALDQDDELRAQLLGRKQFVVAAGNKAGAMRVESKQDMQARGVGSPDRADAVLGAMRKAPDSKPRSYLERDTSRGLIEQAMEESGYDDGRSTDFIAGAFCG